MGIGAASAYTMSSYKSSCSLSHLLMSLLFFIHFVKLRFITLSLFHVLWTTIYSNAKISAKFRNQELLNFAIRKCKICDNLINVSAFTIARTQE